MLIKSFCLFLMLIVSLVECEKDTLMEDKGNIKSVRTIIVYNNITFTKMFISENGRFLLFLQRN